MLSSRVVPVQEEEGEGADDKEEKDPHSQPRIVLHRLEQNAIEEFKQSLKIILKNFN